MKEQIYSTRIRNEAKEKERLRLRRKVPDLSALLREVGEREEMDVEKLRAGRRMREVV